MKNLLIFFVFILMFSCEKEPLPLPQGDCWDCLINSNGLEYKATYCCSEKEIILITNDEAKCGIKITCHKQ